MIHAAPRASTVEEIVLAIQRLRAEGQKVVFTNGVFDLPHPGHVRSLRAARELGDILVVAINSDESVARLKGAGRPVLSSIERAKILASFKMVDFVTVFEEDTPLEVVRAIKPDVIAKGSDYRNREVVGSDVVLGLGGRVEFLPLENGISSTTIVDRIVKAHQ